MTVAQMTPAVLAELAALSPEARASLAGLVRNKVQVVTASIQMVIAHDGVTPAVKEVLSGADRAAIKLISDLDLVLKRR